MRRFSLIEIKKMSFCFSLRIDFRIVLYIIHMNGEKLTQYLSLFELILLIKLQTRDALKVIHDTIHENTHHIFFNESRGFISNFC